MIDTSIIFVQYSQDDAKSHYSRESIKQFWRLAQKDTEHKVEIIVINNGKQDYDFKEYCHIYKDNPENNFAYARNWGFDNSHGKYVCFVDNDIYPDYFFWRDCKELLEKYSDKKFIATPIYTGCHIYSKRCAKGEIDGHLLNKRSGSNCLYMGRETFKDLGYFREDLPRHRVGVEFCNRQIANGYLMIHTRYGLARDMGIFGHKFNVGTQANTKN